MVGADAAVFGSSHCRYRDVGARDCGVGSGAQRNEGDSRLAVYDSEGAHDTGTPLPIIISLAHY